MLKKLVLLVALALLVPSLASAGSFTGIYVFGDSLSDGGNDYLLTFGTFPPFPYAQRFSNGPVAVEQLAGNLGVTLSPSLAGGTNYAYGGAATGQVPIPGAPPSTTDNYLTVEYPPLAPLLAGTGMENQVSAFISSSPAFDPAASLFVVWGGANDFFIDPSAATAAAAVGNLSNEILALYGAGARNFLVPNMPDLSMTPFGLGLPVADQMGLHLLSVGFDTGLASALDSLSGLPGIDITRFDTMAFLNTVIANPGAYGFTDVTDPCFNGETVCADPSAYLFWDSVHPTATGAAILGNEFASAVQPVPEPASLLLLATGLAGAVRAARKRRG